MVITDSHGSSTHSLGPDSRDGRTRTRASDSTSAVAFESVTRQFDEAVALDDVSLVIPAGQTVALLGPNGAGKSTAIGLMLGLLEPTVGSVRTLGLPPSAAVRGGRVGAMLQSAGLPAGALVGELVDFVRALYPRPLDHSNVLGRAGIEALARRRVETLSGGEAQRVRFGLAIAGDPDLVFLDEPTVAMDVESRRGFWDQMRTFASAGRTILFATHYLEEADQVADRIVVLDRGRVIADGTGASIRAGVAERTLRFVVPTADDAALRNLPAVSSFERAGDAVTLSSGDADATVRALVRSGVPFRDLEVAAVDLESAFIRLVSAGGDR